MAPQPEESAATPLTARQRRAQALRQAASAHSSALSSRAAPAPPSRNGGLSSARCTTAAGDAATLSGFGVRTDVSACTVHVLRRDLWDLEAAHAVAQKEAHAAQADARSLREQVVELSGRCRMSEGEVSSLQAQLSARQLAQQPEHLAAGVTA